MTATTLAAEHRHDRAVAVWLLVLCAMVFVMVVLGGVTRLTHSGLSMVEWRPLSGILPPLSESEWMDSFTKYQAYPEYQQLNRGMTLGEYKSIFWLEYIHRLWGRAIGVAFLVPFVWFVVRGVVDRRLAGRLALVFVLGGLQGLLGWYMVKSGLVNRPDVSHYRLTAHLGAAVLIYGVMLWIALGLLRPRPSAPGHRGLWRGALVVLALVVVTTLAGGLVAGLDAGFAYNTFPLMDGQWVPDGLLAIEPWPANFGENALTVQFQHRVLALTTATAVLLLWAAGRRQALPRPARRALDGLAVLALVQVGLGIATLLSVVALPLAAAHQAGALVVLSAAVVAAHTLRPA